MFRLKSFQTNKYDFVVNDHLARSFVEPRYHWWNRFRTEPRVHVFLLRSVCLTN
ncbi:hypothetical protein HanIR_Chr05g0218771 [Helianthus annuus]|nr:hypothetical protein HanIR_Chr05g0218771 [Helianthus annuus]